ncbi:methyltransferase family protein [Nitrosomonas aestuarii]|uniref:methyltransferase family protein n=1 Tax=Nitrosomonas aestuarii TaxID=52441 RepID=UPI001BAB62F2|nr:isoprenylcysteine carboxylmethyltransferase family protein [Nitrosomonas aestuarii]
MEDHWTKVVYIKLGINGFFVQALELKIPPVVLVLVASALMWALSVVFPNPNFAFSGATFVAIVMASAGAAIAFFGVLAFRSVGTTVDPRVPNQSTTLVVHGVYRVSRNPMYVGFFLVLCAWGVFLSNVAALVMLPVFVLYMNRFQIGPEERHMSEKFEDAYRRYRGTVRRWV